MKAVFLVLLFLLTAAVYGQLTITNGDKEAILIHTTHTRAL